VASAAAVAVKPASGMGKQPRGRKGRRGAASNRAEELPLDDETAPPILASAAAAAATDAAASVALNTPEDAFAARYATGTVRSNAPQTPALAASALNLPEDPLSQPPADAVGASLGPLGPPEPPRAYAVCAYGPGSSSAPRESADPYTASANTCEPGAELGWGANTCEPGDGAAAAEAAGAAGSTVGR